MVVEGGGDSSQGYNYENKILELLSFIFSFIPRTNLNVL